VASWCPAVPVGGAAARDATALTWGGGGAARTGFAVNIAMQPGFTRRLR